MTSKPPSEMRTVAALSSLYVFRMLGLFMVFPIMMTMGASYPAATPVLLGAALGIYGITQAIFQIPLGMMSDVWGRKPIIVLGLLIFAFGSFVAASADSVWGLLLGRALQGAGAIASAVMALVGDLTSERNRTKSMAIIGISIGLSFSLAMVLGPIISAKGGLTAVFWVSCGLAFLGILVLLWWVPNPPSTQQPHEYMQRHYAELFKKAISNKDLLRLDVGIFALHFVLTALFVVAPFLLIAAGIQAAKHWTFYLPVMVVSFLLMVPFIYVAERKKKLKPVFLGAIATIMLSLLLLQFASDLWPLVGCLLLFFAASNLLEASLPSLVSKVAAAGSKGTAMGIYSTSQFLGAALGGFAGGFVYQHWGPAGVFWMASGICLIWLFVARGMSAPKNMRSLCFKQILPVVESDLQRTVPGVVEALWQEDTSLLYLKVDDAVFEKENLTAYLKSDRAEAAAAHP